jgi:hypothetical protein
MSKILELDIFGELLENVGSYSKVIEIAVAIDESLPDYIDNSHDSSSLYNLYGGVIQELKKSAYVESELNVSILLEKSIDEYEDTRPEYVSVCLTNNNYTDVIVVQPEMNFDDYRNHKTLGIDFVPWQHLLDKTVKVSSEVAEQVPHEYSVEEYALGHIVWEIAFYGFTTQPTTTDKSDGVVADVDLNSLIQLDTNT